MQFACALRKRTKVKVDCSFQGNYHSTSYSRIEELRQINLMYKALVGLIMIVIGSAIILFSERISRITDAWNRFTLGIQLPENWSRGGAIFVGASMSLYGLLILLRLVAVN